MISKIYIEFCGGNDEGSTVACWHKGRKEEVDLKVIATEAETANQ